MTKTVPERFAEIIELLILAIEAHLLGSYLPDRLAAPLSWRVRSSLEGISNSFAEAFAKFLAARAARNLEPAPELRPQTPARPSVPQPARARHATTARRRRVPALPGAEPNPRASPVAARPPLRIVAPAPMRAMATAPMPRPRKPPNRKSRLPFARSLRADFITI